MAKTYLVFIMSNNNSVHQLCNAVAVLEFVLLQKIYSTECKLQICCVNVANLEQIYTPKVYSNFC